MATVECQVAKVLTEQLIALNAGSRRGVAEGDDVTLWDEVDIDDPQTGERLGSVRVTKLKMTVRSVEETFCTARVSASSSGLFAIFPTAKIRTGRGDGKESVLVSPGDPALITISDDKASGEPISDLTSKAVPGSELGDGGPE